MLSELLMKIAKGEKLTDGELSNLSLAGSRLDTMDALVGGWDDSAGKIKGSAINFPFAPIWNITLEADVDSITIPIEPIYQNLLILARGRCSIASTYVLMQFNDDTGANYEGADWGILNGVAYVAQNLGTSGIATCQFPGTGANANAFGMGLTFIFGAKSSVGWKSALTFDGSEYDSTGPKIVGLASYAAWKSNNAIEKIKLSIIAGNLSANSNFSVFGIP